MRTLLALLISACIPAFAGQGSAAASFAIDGTLANAITGETVRRATVILSPTTDRQNFQTVEVGADGRFSFVHLHPGKYGLIAHARGFPQQSFEQHGNFSTAIAVGPGKNSTGLIFKMNPDATISAQVLDEHNEAVRKARVMLFTRNTDNGKRGIRLRGVRMTDDQGRCVFNHLDAATYYLAVAAHPWFRQYLGPTISSDPNHQHALDPALDVAYPITYYPNTTESSDAGAIVLHPGDRIHADFALTPVRALHVTLRTGAGTPENPIAIPMFMPQVFGVPEMMGISAPMVVRQGSELEVTGLAPGNYTVRERRGENGPAQVLDLRGNTEIDASGASSLEKIQGHVTFEGSTSPKGAVIQLVDIDSERRVGASVGDDGNFEIHPTHAGQYSVVLANTQRFAIRSVTATGARMNGRTLEFSGSQPVQLEITVAEGMGTINGTVVRDGNPVSGAMVVLVPADPANNNPLFRRDQSDSDGTFTLAQVVPGNYRVVAIQNGWELEWATPETLRPYLSNSRPVQVDGKKEYDITVAAQ